MNFDKNTIWAIVLSFIVIVGAFFVNIMFIMPKQKAAMEARQLEQAKLEAEQKEKAQAANEQLSLSSENTGFVENENIELVSESDLTITTDKVKVVFSQKGGDIISYRLTDHFDKDTGLGVEMADNITASNRAFSIAFGDSYASALNETFNVKKEDDHTIGFYRTYDIKDSEGKSQKFMIGKRYSFKDGEYVFKYDITIKPLDSFTGLNINGSSYTIRTSPQVGPHYDPKNNRYDVRQYLSLSSGKRVQKNFSSKEYSKDYEWAGMGGKYFAILVKPASPVNMQPAVRCSVESSTNYQNSQVFLSRKPIENGYVTDEYYVYVGPRSENELIKYNSSDKNAWNLVNSRFNQALQTSGFFSIFETVLKWSLEMIYKLVHNWGVSIIILTVILKVILFPLNKKTAMGSLKMQELQPKMQAIQEKYKNNKQKLGEEMSKLYKQAGYNPTSGCLPMIAQMVILFAMYNVFNNYFEFRGASFIHGWIDDLSVGDSIWSWKTSIPLLSGFTHNNLRLLPFIYTASQLLNGKITQYGNPGAAGQSQASMKFMMYGMPLLFFFLFYNVPSGLLLYWTSSNIFQIGQQIIINRIMKAKRAELAEKQAPAKRR